MTRFAFRRIIAVSVLVAVLGLPLSSVAAPQAAAERSAGRPASAAPALAWLWALVTSSWYKNTCVIDPYGRCITVKNTKPRRQQLDASIPRHPFSVSF